MDPSRFSQNDFSYYSNNYFNHPSSTCSPGVFSPMSHSHSPTQQSQTSTGQNNINQNAPTGIPVFVMETQAYEPYDNASGARERLEGKAVGTFVITPVYEHELLLSWVTPSMRVEQCNFRWNEQNWIFGSNNFRGSWEFFLESTVGKNRLSLFEAEKKFAMDLGELEQSLGMVSLNEKPLLDEAKSSNDVEEANKKLLAISNLNQTLFRFFAGKNIPDYQLVLDLSKGLIASLDGFCHPLLNDTYRYLSTAAIHSGHTKSGSHWLAKAVNNDPSNQSFWVDLINNEHEQGNFDNVKVLYLQSLNYFPESISLIISASSFFERRGEMGVAKSILSLSKKINLEESYKAIIHEAWMEARTGNVDSARQVFFELLSWVLREEKFGRSNKILFEICYEAACFEELVGNLSNAIRIIELAVKNSTKDNLSKFFLYWIHLLDKDSTQTDTQKIEACQFAIGKMFQENLKGRFYLYIAQFQKNIYSIKQSLRHAENCSDEGFYQTLIIDKAWRELPNNKEKSKAIFKSLWEGRKLKALHLVSFFTQYAHFLEYTEGFEAALQFLQEKQKEFENNPNLWKLWLESTLLLLRNKQFNRALTEVQNGLEKHPNSGRLWGLYIMLLSQMGHEEGYEAFKKAVFTIPKSGEIWNEGAKIHMNPLSPHFNLELARKYIEFAQELTPQYIDVNITKILLEILEGGLNQEISLGSYSKILSVKNFYGSLWTMHQNLPSDSFVDILKNARENLVTKLKSTGLQFPCTQKVSPDNLAWDEKDNIQQIVSGMVHFDEQADQVKKMQQQNQLNSLKKAWNHSWPISSQEISP